MCLLWLADHEILFSRMQLARMQLVLVMVWFAVTEENDSQYPSAKNLLCSPIFMQCMHKNGS